MNMKTLAIPNFGNRISPRFDYAETFQLIKIDNDKIIERNTIKIISHNRLERINMMLGLKPDIIICDGISELSIERLTENNIQIISWVNGEIEEILKKYLCGNLIDKKRTKI